MVGGSSSKRVLAGSTSMRARATRLRSPPLSALMGFFLIVAAKGEAPAMPRRKFVSACAETSASDSESCGPWFRIRPGAEQSSAGDSMPDMAGSFSNGNTPASILSSVLLPAPFFTHQRDALPRSTAKFRDR